MPHMFRVPALTFLIVLLLFCAQTFRVVTDQLGPQVTIPDRVGRVVVLQHQTLNLLVQLDATDTMASILGNWKQQLRENYARLVPQLSELPTLGDLTHAGLEMLVALHPQVVFVPNQAPKAMIDQIQ